MWRLEATVSWPAQKFLAVGPVHRLHHVNWTKQGDVNFGLFFTFWDSLLGNSQSSVPNAYQVSVISASKITATSRTT